MVDGEHGAHVGQKRLRGANVGGGLVAPDVLFARLQRQSKCVISLSVSRDADHSSRHHSQQLLSHREKAGVRPSVTKGNAETLSVAKGNVESKFT